MKESGLSLKEPAINVSPIKFQESYSSVVIGLGCLPEIREVKKLNQFSEIALTLINSCKTTDDMLITNKTLVEMEKFKLDWKSWLQKEYAFGRLAFDLDWDCWEDVNADKVDLNQSMMRDRALLKAPSLVLGNLQNKGFPGIQLMGQQRQADDSFIWPSKEFQETFLKEMGVIPEGKTISDTKSFNKANTGEDIVRPSFDKRPGIEGNLKGRLGGVYFELDTNKGGGITAFFNIKTLEELVR